jgi:hypothetical protein
VDGDGSAVGAPHPFVSGGTVRAPDTQRALRLV